MENNEALVDHLVKSGHIESDRVEKAFRSVDRADFVSESFQPRAYIDRALPLDPGATISAPHMVAINTELLDVEPGDTVLEIGSGSGYQAAILSELAQKVVGIEILQDLVENSRERLQSRENIEIRHGNGFGAVEDEEIFDKILYSCAVKDIEEAHKHLRQDGVIVAPLKKNGEQVLTHYSEGKLAEHGRVSFVDKIGGEPN